jgi:hypothetical protein
MTAFRESSTYDLADLRARIPGRPVYRISVDEIDPKAQLCAAWACGCRASGERFATLALAACDEHRALDD